MRGSVPGRLASPAGPHAQPASEEHCWPLKALAGLAGCTPPHPVFSRTIPPCSRTCCPLVLQASNAARLAGVGGAARNTLRPATTWYQTGGVGGGVQGCTV